MVEVNLASISIVRHLGSASSFATRAVAILTISVAVAGLLMLGLVLQSVRLDEMVPVVGR